MLEGMTHHKTSQIQLFKQEFLGKAESTGGQRGFHFVMGCQTCSLGCLGTREPDGLRDISDNLEATLGFTLDMPAGGYN